MSALTESERGLLHGVLRFDRAHVLDHAPRATAQHVRQAMSSPPDTGRLDAASRLRGALPRDRDAVKGLRGDLPPHWRSGLDRIASGASSKADQWIATLLTQRLGDRLDESPCTPLDFDLAAICADRSRLWKFLRRVGLEGIGLVASGLERRRLVRLLRSFDPDDRELVRAASEKTADEALVKLVSDAFVRLADIEPAASERAEDLGLFLVAFAFADDRNAEHASAVANGLDGRRRNQFGDFVTATRNSSRRDLADDVLAFITETESR